MSYTYGYLREAILAHIDLDESETDAMHLLERFHIFANEAMQAICSVKPKYKYFECKIIKQYDTIIEVYADNNISYRLPTNDERYYLLNNAWPDGHIPADEEAPQVADEYATSEFYHNQHTYLLNEAIAMPDDFIAFAVKQAYKFVDAATFNFENFIMSVYEDAPITKTEIRKPIGNDDFAYTSDNNVTFYNEGHYLIPYKAIWFLFKSDVADTELIDMPIDIFVCIPLYVAAEALQIDYAQKAQLKRSEFEIALSRVTSTNMMALNQITPTFK